jgi:hypothetical protein
MATDLPSATDPGQPQRVCPHCATVSRTTARECPHCRRSFRRRSPLLPAVVAGLVSALATTAAVAALLAVTADDVDEKVSDEIDVVQLDLERQVGEAQREIEAEVARLRRDLPTTP